MAIVLQVFLRTWNLFFLNLQVAVLNGTHASNGKRFKIIVIMFDTFEKVRQIFYLNAWCLLLKISSFHLYLTQSNRIGNNVSSGWYDQLFPWKTDKCLKKLRSNKSSEKYFYKQERFICKIYLHLKSQPELINFHYISFTQNCYKVCLQSCTIFSFFIVDNIYYFVIKRLSVRASLRPTLL